MSGDESVRALLEGIYREALRAVDPAAAVRAVVRRSAATGCLEIAGEPVASDSRLVVLAVGKAAGAMAAALEEVAGTTIAAGLAVVPEGSRVSLDHIALREAAHPVPDLRCARAAEEAIALVAGARPGDVLVGLISGGASSLLSCPVAGLSLPDLAATTAALLAGGAPIDELNAVRKHLSRVAGGRLAAHAACERIHVLAISDVPGDRLDVIGSGPLVGDPSRYSDALDALDQRARGASVPVRVRSHLEAGARGELDETPEPDAAIFDRVHTVLLASNADARRAACAAAERAGVRAVELGATLAGAARDAGRRLAAWGVELRTAAPVCAVAGGETTVEVRGRGRGGRSQELALAAALELEGRDGIALLAAGTDGIDGPTDAAGAHADCGTVARGRALGLDASAALDDNDSHTFFAAEGGLVRTGPTGTNVMDLALLYAAP